MVSLPVISCSTSTSLLFSRVGNPFLTNSDYASVNPQNFHWYSLPSNWHCPSELLPYLSQPFVDLSSWMLKGSIPTSGLNSEMIPFLQNTSTISQTQSGPSIPTVYYATSDAFTFRIPAISNYVFFNTRMTTPLQVTSVRQRLFTKSACTTTGPDFWSTSKTTANCVPPVPAPNLCATDLTDFSSNF